MKYPVQCILAILFCVYSWLLYDWAGDKREKSVNEAWQKVVGADIKAFNKKAEGLEALSKTLGDKIDASKNTTNTNLDNLLNKINGKKPANYTTIVNNECKLTPEFITDYNSLVLEVNRHLKDAK